MLLTRTCQQLHAIEDRLAIQVVIRNDGVTVDVRKYLHQLVPIVCLRDNLLLWRLPNGRRQPHENHRTTVYQHGRENRARTHAVRLSALP